MVKQENKQTHAFHTAIINKVPLTKDPSRPIFKVDCHNITLLDLLSFEVNHLKQELDLIRNLDRSYQVGWLHDDTVNVFHGTSARTMVMQLIVE